LKSDHLQFSESCPVWIVRNGYDFEVMADIYEPTTDQSQAGDLKTKFLVESYPHRMAGLKGWAGKVVTDNGHEFIATECGTWMIAVVKAILYSCYTDGMIPCAE